MTKRILLSLILWGGVSLIGANAQRTDGFFKTNNDDFYTNREDNGFSLGGVTNNENPTPLGSGLLIMVAAGAGYAVERRKNAARKGMTMLVALGLILGMTQCKKDTVTPVSTDNKINITLNANYGGNGGRTTFEPTTGQFSWSTSQVEYINVGGAAGYLGQLSNDGAGSNTFTGTITGAVDGETLYFFYLGNGNHAGATTLDFSNQSSGTVTDYHIAIGSAEYKEGQTNFSATLNMAMAIAYFDLSGFTSSSDAAETVYIHGDAVYATATVDYNNGTITGNTKGFINVGTANAGKYVALIPSVTTSTTIKFESNTKTGSMTFLRGIKPASYYSNGGSTLAPTLGTLPEGATPGLFTVAGEEVNGNKISTRMVRFSKGNLQYQANSTGAETAPYTPAWRFAPKQYTFIGDAAGNNVFDDSRATQEDWIDLFGWGTSGWNNGNTYYQPYDYIGNSGTTSTGYGYGPAGNNYKQDLTGTYANADWGIYNAIGNDAAGTWRTPTGGSGEEWEYLLSSRNASTVNGTDNARFGKIKVDNVNGIVIFPDSYNHPISKNPAYINSTTYSSTYTAITTDEFNSMQSAGAVFLPCNGYRSYAYPNYDPTYSTNSLYYWSATYNSQSYAYAFLGGHSVGITSSNTSAKRNGCAVRLVYDVK